jgi:hypothetical protein
MRKVLFLALMALFAGPSARADPAARERLRCYFTSWFSVCAGTTVTVAEASEIQTRLGRAPTASGRGSSR